MRNYFNSPVLYALCLALSTAACILHTHYAYSFFILRFVLWFSVDWTQHTADFCNVSDVNDVGGLRSQLLHQMTISRLAEQRRN